MTTDIFVARQPIFDLKDRIYGYELLFQSGPDNFFAHADPDAASAEAIGTSLLGFGLQDLTGGRPAFVNVSRRVLLEELYTVLPTTAILEILETVDPDEEVLKACHRARAHGYRLALDDFIWAPRYEKLLPLVDIVKVDYQSMASRESQTELLRLPRLTCLAEKVETTEERADAVQRGFTLFQGYFFCRPEMISQKDVKAGKMTTLRFLAEMNVSDPSFERIEQLIRGEVALSVKLLRYLNSAGFGWRHEVDTIAQAIRVLGVVQLRKWSALMAVMSLAENRPQSLAITALVRARFCEIMGPKAGVAGRELELFLVGLLSLIDAMVGRPMPELLDQLAVSPPMRAALLDGGPPLGEVMRLVVAYESGDWPGVAALQQDLGLQTEDAATAYGEAVRWADLVVASA